MSFISNTRAATLVAQGNNPNLLAAGNTVDDLSNGEIGVFNADTGQSIDETTSPYPSRIFVAVRHNNETIRSLGVIDTANVKDVDFHCYQAHQAQQVTLSGFAPLCNTAHVIKAELTFGAGLRTDGFQPVTEKFSVMTEPCANCEDCGDADCDQFVSDMVDAINNSSEYMTATVSVQGDETVCDEINITMDINAIKEYCQIPEDVDEMPVVTAKFSAAAGFNAPFTVTETQAPIVGTGIGDQIKMNEYFRAGWQSRGQGQQGSPYRIFSDGHQPSFAYQVDEVGLDQYFVINITYFEDQVTGTGQSFRNDVTLELAVDNNTDDTATDPTNSVEHLMQTLDGVFGTSFQTESQAC